MSDQPRAPAPAPAQSAAPEPPALDHWTTHLYRQLAVLALLAALVALGYFGQDALKLLGPPQRCWEYKEIEGKLYKVNPCTGQFQLVGDVVAPEEGK